AIDAKGRITAIGLEGRENLVDVDGVLFAAVALPEHDRPTLYARIGDLVGWICLGGALLITLALTLLARSSRKTPPEPESP
ncbi:MAG: hypothetical protein VYC34_02045, partial [Planctomycetota bacterium]|nr:hypothetical protein [Planctomycetota bacterium]